MIAKYYGRNYTLQTLRDKAFITREGVSMLGISEAAESIGFRTQGVRITFNKLAKDTKLPCILHWNQNHFVVCYGIRKVRKLPFKNTEQDYVIKIADPAIGLLNYNKKEFLQYWGNEKYSEESGSVLLIQPKPDFYELADEKDKTNATKKLPFYFQYIKPFKSQLFQLVVGMIIGSLIQLIIPFLTQSMVDVGIGTYNISFIKLILISQLILFITQLAINFIQGWIGLHMNTRISISLISDFLAKLLKLPISFFDTKNIGDIIQRIGDHGRIQSFLVGTSITTLFSFANFIIFGVILAYYNLTILVIFLIGNALYVMWILAFMRIRRQLDYRRFNQSSKNQSALYQLITGAQEIKLNTCEKQKRWQWERIQINLFRISTKGLAIGQFQQTGSVFFSQITNIIISYLSAKAAVDGTMTLGMMMSLSYIIGQLSAPIGQIIGFAQSLQDAKISLERLGEIHDKEDEEQSFSGDNISIMPENKTIKIQDLSFSYDGADRNYVLKDINLIIPENKVTAIVGESGSGKTTLMKLLLGFYQPNKGEIFLGNVPVKNINPRLFRRKSGVVMQDGFIFSDTIVNNIVIDNENIDKEHLIYSTKAANIKDFIDSLPLGFNSKIGMEGNGISQGQKQRILIARAIYKRPDYMFFDEATNSLDSNNEKTILNNLNEFYKGKTVVIIAHRLSTVQNADNIIVLNKGFIVEQGSHQELIKKGGHYYQLVKNQLDLGYE
jgi:ATP-binding cassette subfamily B protein